MLWFYWSHLVLTFDHHQGKKFLCKKYFECFFVFFKSYELNWPERSDENVLVTCHIHLLNEKRVVVQISSIHLLYMTICFEGWGIFEEFERSTFQLIKIWSASWLVYIQVFYSCILFQRRVIKFHIKSKWNIFLQSFYLFVSFFKNYFMLCLYIFSIVSTNMNFAFVRLKTVCVEDYSTNIKLL